MKQAAPLTGELKERLQDSFAQVPFAHLLGLELGELEPGAATIYLPLREALKRNKGVLHGGVTASLIDSAAAFAAMTLLESGEATTTVDLTIHYLRPLIEGRAAARARVLRAGRRVLVISVDVFDETEALVATALTTYLRLTENLQATSGR
jgi:uncharacterized protein (TIGR00369 family)